MQEHLGQSLHLAYGQQVKSWARFSPAASPAAQVLKDAFGIRSITRDAAGRWTVQLDEKAPSFVAHITVVENDTTNLHDVRVESYDYDAGTFTFVHRTAAYGSVASMALSDTVDELWVEVIGRKAT